MKTSAAKFLKYGALAALAFGASAAMAQTAPSASSIIGEGGSTIIKVAMTVFYIAAAVIIIATGGMVMWSGDKSYIIKGISIALGAVIAGKAVDLLGTFLASGSVNSTIPSF